MQTLLLLIFNCADAAHRVPYWKSSFFEDLKCYVWALSLEPFREAFLGWVCLSQGNVQFLGFALSGGGGAPSLPAKLVRCSGCCPARIKGPQRRSERGPGGRGLLPRASRTHRHHQQLVAGTAEEAGAERCAGRQMGGERGRWRRADAGGRRRRKGGGLAERQGRREEEGTRTPRWAEGGGFLGRAERTGHHLSPQHRRPQSERTMH